MAARRWLLIALTLLSASCARNQEVPASDAGAEPAASEAAATAVRTVAATQPDGRRTLTFLATAKTDENRIAILTSPVPGKIIRLFAAEGQQVRKGQPLVEIESQALAEAELAYVKALADLRYQERQYGRDAGLLKQGALSGDELRQSESALVKARADLSAAETQLGIYHAGAADIARLRQTGKVRGTLVLPAPLSGHVLERQARLGEAVPPERGLMTLVDHERLWVLARVPETEVAHVQDSGAATVRFKALPGRTYAGHRIHLHDAVDGGTRTVELKLWVANPDHLLRPDMFATVDLPVSTGTAGALVPRGALQAAPGGDVVIVAAGGKYAVRPVQVLETNNGQIRVQGVKVGEAVVTEGAQALKATLLAVPEGED